MSIQRVIVIVGASTGIGAGLARYFSNEAQSRLSRYGLVLVARREVELNQMAESVRNDYCSTLAISCDVTKRDEVEKILQQTNSTYSFISCWINNVGQGISRSVLQLTDHDIDTMVSVNIKSALYGMQVVIPYFRQQGYGHLFNISSVLGRIPYVGYRSMYSASKAALNSLTTNLRMELQTDPRCEKIFVTTVLPGLVETNFSLNIIGDAPPKSFADYKVPFVGPLPRTAQTVDDVCLCIGQALDSADPPREIYTNPEHIPFVKEFFDDVGKLELKLKPPTS